MDVYLYYQNFPIPKPSRKKRRVTKLSILKYKMVRQIYANACAICLERNNLEVHHTKFKQMGGSRYRDDLENLVLLCGKHHKETHG